MGEQSECEKKKAREKKKKTGGTLEQEVAARTGRGWALRRPGSGACRVPINDYKLFRASRPQCSVYLPLRPQWASQLMTCRARRKSLFWLPVRQFFLFSLLPFSLFSFSFSFFLLPSNPLVVRALVRLVSPEQFLRVSLANRQSRPSTIQATPSFSTSSNLFAKQQDKKDPFCLHPLHVSRLTQQA
ncbi:hypothetical protein HDV64DRAFT_117139 [Trichoderma sp. TUCIM 5745]